MKGNGLSASGIKENDSEQSMDWAILSMCWKSISQYGSEMAV